VRLELCVVRVSPKLLLRGGVTLRVPAMALEVATENAGLPLVCLADFDFLSTPDARVLFSRDQLDEVQKLVAHQIVMPQDGVL
jgi:hypothetical protein